MTSSKPQEPFCFTFSDLQALSQANADRFIEMLYNQQERNEYGEMYDTAINATLEFLINAVKEEFFKE